jgi:ERCC4-type nuclease
MQTQELTQKRSEELHHENEKSPLMQTQTVINTNDTKDSTTYNDEQHDPFSQFTDNTTAFAKQQKALQNIEVIIFADTRERSSKTLRLLYEQPITLKLQRLEVGDYQLSKDVVVEFKRVSDFVGSLIDGRLLEQVKTLKRSVLKPLIIIEGEQSIFSQRNISPNAIYGMLSTITVSYQVPILFTRNEQETAGLMVMIAKREQERELRFQMQSQHLSQSQSDGSDISKNNQPISLQPTYALHALKPKSEKEQLEYIVSAIPQVGTSAARKLLEHFGSIAQIACASEDEICEINGIGKQSAKKIIEFLQKDYRELRT